MHKLPSWAPLGTTDMASPTEVLFVALLVLVTLGGNAIKVEHLLADMTVHKQIDDARVEEWRDVQSDLPHSIRAVLNDAMKASRAEGELRLVAASLASFSGSGGLGGVAPTPEALRAYLVQHSKFKLRSAGLTRARSAFSRVCDLLYTHSDSLWRLLCGNACHGGKVLQISARCSLY